MQGLYLDYALFKAFWSSLDYCYIGLQSFFAYDFSGRCFEACAWLKDNDYMLSYEILSHFAISVAGFELFTSVLYDLYVKDVLCMLEVSENTLRRYIASLDPTLFAIYHPEFGYFKRTGHTNFLSQFGADVHFFIADNLQAYSLILPLTYIAQAAVLMYGIVLFVAVFFSFFNSSLKEEGSVDNEFTMVNLITESEKELFAAEDAKYVVVMFLVLFGAYFGLLAFAFGPTANPAVFFTALVPALILSVLNIPCNLLFDFGLLFLLYLRGSSNTNSFFFELVYDYIGVTAFFTRLVVQFVRMVLMFVVYTMMHDTIVLQKVAH